MTALASPSGTACSARSGTMPVSTVGDGSLPPKTPEAAIAPIAAIATTAAAGASAARPGRWRWWWCAAGAAAGAGGGGTVTSSSGTAPDADWR